MLQQDSNSSKWSQREHTPGLTPGLTTHPPQSSLKEVTQLFDRMYNNLNSMRLPTASQQDENLLDDSSSFKERVQIRDFSEYLKPKRTQRETSPQPKMGYGFTPQAELSSPNFSPKLTPQHPKDRSQSRVEASQVRTMLAERENEIFQLKQKIKELESVNKQLEGKILAKGKQIQPQSALLKELQQELQFTTQNNQHLYRNTQKLQEQIDKFKADIEGREKREKELQEKLGELEKQIATLKKINKQLLKEQSNIVRTSEEQVLFFRTVKDQFEKENNLLKKKIQFLEVERNTSLNVLRNITAGDKFFNSLTNRPVEELDPTPSPSEVNKLRSQLQIIKANVNELSTRKNSSSVAKPKRSSSRKSNLRIQ